MSIHLVLDMDQTLIDCDGQQNKIFSRPYLQYFFSFIFEHFDSVSIWTHATKGWFGTVYMKILRKVLPKGKSFRFVITSNSVIDMNTSIVEPREQFPQIPNMRYLFTSKTIYKNLKYIYDRWPEYNENNTFIVDDNVGTYQLNPINAIPIRPFSYKSWNTDRELLRIIDVFRRHLISRK